MEKKLKLNSLAEYNLTENQMSGIKGGTLCGCACAYAGSGGSSTGDNGVANNAGGKFSPGHETIIVMS